MENSSLENKIDNSLKLQMIAKGIVFIIAPWN